MIDVPKEGAFNDAKQNTKLEAIKKRIGKSKVLEMMRLKYLTVVSVGIMT